MAGHPRDAGKIAHFEARLIGLVAPVDGTGQRDMFVPDHNHHPPLRNRYVPVEYIDGASGDLRIGQLRRTQEMHFQLLDHGSHAFDALDRRLGSQLLRVTAHGAGEGDNTILDQYADIAFVDHRRPLKLVLDQSLERRVIHVAATFRIKTGWG